MENWIYTFNEISSKVHEISSSKGWDFDETDTNVLATKIALMHSELSEALEALRNNVVKSDHIPEFSGLEEEFADTIIRIMHVSYKLKLKVASAILAKLEFNSTRLFKHGNKLF